MDFFRAFTDPDHDEHPEKATIIHAANLLQIGEFQLLQLAYRKAHGKDMDEHLTDRMFHAYMLRNTVPSWALRYAQYICELETRDMLTPQDPTYHRYDSDYDNYIPGGVRKFVVATGAIVVVMAGALMIGHAGTFKATSVLPPYFDEKQLDKHEATPSDSAAAAGQVVIDPETGAPVSVDADRDGS